MTQGADILEADYLVVGAGATGMAFTDALIDHADVTWSWSTVGTGWVGIGWTRTRSSASIRRRRSTAWPRRCSAAGGIQQDGPEAGLHERATAPEICAYYARVLRERMLASGRVSFHPNCEYVGDGQVRVATVRAGGTRCASGRASSTPATSHPGYRRGRRRRSALPTACRCVAVNDLVTLEARAVAST